jgi:hypothetical protein
MKLAIMQPYFFPYLGYFRLISAVDKFIIHDDVQYIKGGWINKNRILLNNRDFKIVIPIKSASARCKINERCFIEDSYKFKIKLLRQIENAYLKAPFYDEVYPFISRIVLFEEGNLAKYNTQALKEICRLIDITTPFYISSEINKENNLTGEERVINLNRIMGSSMYINPVGGVDLYHKESFLKSNIYLRFLITEDYCYNQFGKIFVPNLSVIDLLMFNSKESIKILINKYHLE